MDGGCLFIYKRLFLYQEALYGMFFLVNSVTWRVAIGQGVAPICNGCVPPVSRASIFSNSVKLHVQLSLQSAASAPHFDWVQTLHDTPILNNQA